MGRIKHAFQSQRINYRLKQGRFPGPVLGPNDFHAVSEVSVNTKLTFIRIDAHLQMSNPQHYRLTFALSSSSAAISVTLLPIPVRKSRSGRISDSSIRMSVTQRLPFWVTCKRFPPTHETNCSATARSIALENAGSKRTLNPNNEL